jgi:hypothetical protein
MRTFGEYGVVLYVHSLIRWAVLAAGFYAAARAWRGRLRKEPWLTGDTRAGRMFITLLDVQLLVGIVLYAFFSPIVKGLSVAADVTIGSRGGRFWIFEHPISAIIAIALAHVGFMKAKQGGEAAHRDASLFYTLALLVVLAALPWPIFSYGRALWPTW